MTKQPYESPAIESREQLCAITEVGVILVSGGLLRGGPTTPA